MKPKKAPGKMITTTIREDLWLAIQMQATADDCEVNDILERLIQVYLDDYGELCESLSAR